MNMRSSPHSVTMSALAASTATVSGVFSSMSAAFWFAPLFRNKHTCLKCREGNISFDCGDLKKAKKQTNYTLYISWTSGQTQCGPAWWRGGGVLGPERPAGSHWPRFAAGTRRWPVTPGFKHQCTPITFPHKQHKRNNIYMRTYIEQ